MKRYTILFSALLALLFTGCANLAPDGPYKGDQVLYRADTVIPVSYTMLHTYVKWEYDNRAVLATTPEIKQSADYIRLNARSWITSAITARELYALQPTDANKSKLETVLNILSAALNEATKYMTAYAPKTATPVK